MQNSD